jgi:uncharacterized membrane protein (DUF4010 family)
MSADETLAVAARLGVASLVGLAVGVEREWSAAARRTPHRFAGVRTFPLLGLVAGVAATIADAHPALGAALAGAAGALIVVAYAVAARRGDPDATTETAALVVLAAGLLAGFGEIRIAGAIAAITVLALAEKSRLHAFVRKIDPATLAAGARFGVLALVVLPLLPEGPYGPEPGFRPRELWIYVLVLSGVGFAAHVTTQAVGRERGVALAGLLGGLVSSTAVTLHFARRSRDAESTGGAYVVAVLAACAIVPARMIAFAALIRPEAAVAAAPFLAGPFVTSVVVALVARRGGAKAKPQREPTGNPLRLWPALQMAAVFQLVLYAVHWSSRFGSGGVFVSAGLAGLTDVDALSFSLTKLGVEPQNASTYGRALAVGLLSNTLFRTGVVALVGRGAFRTRCAAGLAVIAASCAAAILLVP